MKPPSLTFLLAALFSLFPANVQSASFRVPEEREDITPTEDLLNFGVVYGVQLAVYGITQRETIKQKGSLENWLKNPFSVGFDKDSFDYNIFQHALSGQFYYLFYRSQGHTIKNAFFWSCMSSLAFEFTIETITERPSLQDIYQTPVFGAVAGIGIEKVSRLLHRSDTFLGHGLGYLLNPLSLLPNLSQAWLAVPTVSDKSVGVMVGHVF